MYMIMCPTKFARLCVASSFGSEAQRAQGFGAPGGGCLRGGESGGARGPRKVHETTVPTLEVGGAIWGSHAKQPFAWMVHLRSNGTDRDVWGRIL